MPSILGRRAPAPNELGSYIPAAPVMHVLRADGRRINLSSKASSQALVSTRQAWIGTAWAYRDLIGELRYAVKLLSQSVARVRFYPAEVRPWPEEPIPLNHKDCTLDTQLIADAQHNFDLLPLDHNPDGFTARLVENLSIAGEAWIHIDTRRTVKVRSTSEITASMDGTISLVTAPGSGATKQILTEDDELLRCWIPHPEWSELADSPMRALLDVAEDVVLTGREMRAASRSRVAANGVLLIPIAMTILKDRAANDDGEGDDEDTFMQDLTAAMLAPLEDDGQAGQVVPVILRGDSEELEKVRHLTLQRDSDDELINRQSAALLRLLKGLDVQPEQVDGVSSMNHWSAWIVDTKSIKDQVEPKAETVAACLAQAYLRPALESLDGYSPQQRDQIKSIVIVADASDLAENPNRGQDAVDAHDRDAISDAALRSAKGFTEDDAPDEAELVRRALTKGRITPQAIPLIVKALQGQVPDEQDVQQALNPTQPGAPPIVDATPTGPPALPPGSSDTPVAQPGQVTPSRPTPAPPTGTAPNAPAYPVTAAGAPGDDVGLVLTLDASRRLADIDAALADRIHVAAEAALARVVERAGAKVRTKARTDVTLTDQIAGMDAAAIPALLGRERVEALVSVAELVTDPYDRLRSQVTGWLTAAAGQVADTVCAVVNVDTRTARGRAIKHDVTATLADHVDAAWQHLHAELVDAAEWGLFHEPGDPEGEDGGDPLSAQDVADALAIAGGAAPALTASAATFARNDRGQRRRHRRPPKRLTDRATPGAGMATGPAVRDVIAAQGGVVIGHTWNYRPEILRNEFSPHHKLNGTLFTTWQDSALATDSDTAWLGPFFAPGDHRGCRCNSSPAVVSAGDPDGHVADELRRAHGNPTKVTATLRDRVTGAVDDMREEFLSSPRRRR